MTENGRKISKVTYSDGSKYSGEMKGFLRHGHGTYKWFNGGRYTGNWVEGEMDGKGTMTYIDGSTYVGMFQFGTEHGEGKFKSYDGFKYQGEFVEGKPLGGDEYLPPFRSPEPKALEWAEKNKWFGEDEIMTSASMDMHREIIDEGIEVSSENYYAELDARIQKSFPQKFSKGEYIQKHNKNELL